MSETDVQTGLGHSHKGSPANDSRLVGTVLPWGIISIPNFTLSFILTFERILREDDLVENSLEVDHFSVLKGESDLYEFLTWHKGTRGCTVFHPNCIPRLLESSLSLAFCLVMQLRLVIMIP